MAAGGSGCARFHKPISRLRPPMRLGFSVTVTCTSKFVSMSLTSSTIDGTEAGIGGHVPCPRGTKIISGGVLFHQQG